jgi:heme o synthase
VHCYVSELKSISVIQKIKDYLLFTKFRLSFTVVLSAVLGYFFVAEQEWVWRDLLLISVGGSLLTCASIGSNQIWERNFDKQMNRTKNRPLPSGRMSLTEAYIAVSIFLIAGLSILFLLNYKTFLLGVLAYVSYAFMYTPIKRHTPWAVFMGAIPGALPPLMGAVAFTGNFTFETGILFFIQFVWQFPHFWAIAWVAHDDYERGGFSLLPLKSNKSKGSASLIVLYSIFLIPFTLIPWVVGMTGTWSLVVGGLMSVLFFLSAYKLYLTLDNKDAKICMFASFIYLPVVQLVLVLDKIPQ